jgi:hypothetical protein
MSGLLELSILVTGIKLTGMKRKMEFLVAKTEPASVALLQMIKDVLMPEVLTLEFMYGMVIHARIFSQSMIKVSLVPLLGSMENFIPVAKTDKL